MVVSVIYELTLSTIANDVCVSFSIMFVFVPEVPRHSYMLRRSVCDGYGYSDYAAELTRHWSSDDQFSENKMANTRGTYDHCMPWRRYAVIL